MKKPKSTAPRWVVNLRALMQARGLNPRSLSLKAGLNATAVRDMLEGRTRFPRYDTVKALAGSLGVTPASLMGDEAPGLNNTRKIQAKDDDLDLLTEIIARLQEVIEEYNHPLPPRDFAAMVASLYRRVNAEGSPKGARAALQPKIVDLVSYEALRRRARR